MQIEIKAALTEAQASAVMIVENYFSGAYSPERIAALNAIATAQNRPHPAHALKAEEAALAYLATVPEIALELINKRIAARAAKAPLSDAASRALHGRD